jgi:hypothetical protein
MSNKIKKKKKTVVPKKQRGKKQKKKLIKDKRRIFFVKTGLKRECSMRLRKKEAASTKKIENIKIRKNLGKTK